MKLKTIFIAPLIALFAFTAPVYADNDNGGQHKNGQPGIQNPENREGGHERGEFEHHVGEFGESGFEPAEIILIGAAVAVAIFLAYTAGKRSRKKKEKE
jgi:hypothetical protein